MIFKHACAAQWKKYLGDLLKIQRKRCKIIQKMQIKKFKFCVPQRARAQKKMGAVACLKERALIIFFSILRASKNTTLWENFVIFCKENVPKCHNPFALHVKKTWHFRNQKIEFYWNSISTQKSSQNFGGLLPLSAPGEAWEPFRERHGNRSARGMGTAFGEVAEPLRERHGNRLGRDCGTVPRRVRQFS